ncbi:MAG: glutamate--tRNA ligase [Patescibacteria group bacterium]
MAKNSAAVVTRFAPSPTGPFHLGSARTALFNYLFARKNSGKFILRTEDTDKERSKKEFEEDIINGLKWLGIDWDEFYRQSERGEIYKKYLEKLLNEGKAYFDDRAIRFKNPNKKVVFNDLIREEIEFKTNDVGDFVIAKDKDTPLFHFAVVVDDYEMGITHVIRGEDHISNTPRQILIQEALGFKTPRYAHIPLILASDKSKLSKRHGAVSLADYKKDGYLPEAIINFIAFIGWNPGDNKEIFTKDELIREFSLERIQKGGAVFNIERLNWLNKEYIKKLDAKILEDYLTGHVPDNWKKIAEDNPLFWSKIVSLEKERISKLSDIKEGAAYFFETPVFDKKLLFWKKEKDIIAVKKHLEKIAELLSVLDEKNFISREIKEAVWGYAEKEGRGNVFWPLRVALTGLEKSPDPFIVAEILGKNETLERLEYAIDII